MKQTSYSLEELKALKANSTQVVAWYYHPSDAEVRGPFCRWLKVTEVADEYKKNVGSRDDDAKYAAAAMTALPELIQTIEELQAKVQKLEASLEMDNMLRSK